MKNAPLTDEELDNLSTLANSVCAAVNREGSPVGRAVAWSHGALAVREVPRLVAEIRSLRAENDAMRKAVQVRNEEIDRLLAELDEPRGNLGDKKP